MARARKPLEQRMRETSAWRLADHENPNPHSVYRLWAADGTLLYIGCASDVEHRVYMHRYTCTMVDAFLIQRHYDHHTSEVYPTKLEARAGEAAAIKAERPICNRQHNPTRWRRARGQGYVPADAETAEIHARLSAQPKPNPEFVEFLDSMFSKPPVDDPAAPLRGSTVEGRGGRVSVPPRAPRRLVAT